jgi:hypothetical protein
MLSRNNNNRINVSTGGTTVIEVAINTSCSSQEQQTCHICADALCPLKECCRTGVHLACCTQRICAQCLLKMCKRCRCDAQCTAVIAFCPYCRDISPVAALDLFRATQRAQGCRNCRQDDDHNPQDAIIISSGASSTVGEEIIYDP